MSTLFISTRDYLGRIISALAGHLPNPLAAIISTYVRHPYIDICNDVHMVRIYDNEFVIGQGIMDSRPSGPFADPMITHLLSFWRRIEGISVGAGGVTYLHTTCIELWNFICGDDSAISPMLMPALSSLAPGREADILAKVRDAYRAIVSSKIQTPAT